MQSPTKYSKKTRKNTFGQVAVAQSEVGDFQGGYFVMPDATSSKENDCPYKTRASNTKALDRSPARRKHQTHEFTSPSKPRFEQDFKKPFAELDPKKETSRSELTTPGSYTASPKKSAPGSPQHSEYPDQKYTSCKDLLSTSPSSSGRWAGPAFGNAPHPSSLPLPEFPPMNSSAVSTPSPFMTQDSHLSQSPPSHDGAFLGMAYQHPHHFSLSSSPTHPHLTSIPTVPFPYVGVHLPLIPQASAPSLAQLSTDLRRMLNINGPMPMSDPIMVANSC